MEVDEAVLVERHDLVVEEECLLLETLESVEAALLDSHDGIHFALNVLILFDDEAEDTEMLAIESTRCGQRSAVGDASMSTVFLSLSRLAVSLLLVKTVSMDRSCVDEQRVSGAAEIRKKGEDQWKSRLRRGK